MTSMQERQPFAHEVFRGLDNLRRDFGDCLLGNGPNLVHWQGDVENRHQRGFLSRNYGSVSVQRATEHAVADAQVPDVVEQNFRQARCIEDFPAAHDCFAPYVRDFQSANCDTEVAESSCANIADQCFANIACSYRPETARQVRTSPLQGIDQSGVLT